MFFYAFVRLYVVGPPAALTSPGSLLETQALLQYLLKNNVYYSKISHENLGSSNPTNNFTSGYILKTMESMVSKRYLYTFVHSNIIYKSQKVETTQVSIDGWTNKQNFVCIHNETLILK